MLNACVPLFHHFLTPFQFQATMIFMETQQTLCILWKNNYDKTVWGFQSICSLFGTGLDMEYQGMWYEVSLQYTLYHDLEWSDPADISSNNSRYTKSKGQLSMMVPLTEWLLKMNHAELLNLSESTAIKIWGTKRFYQGCKSFW